MGTSPLDKIVQRSRVGPVSPEEIDRILSAGAYTDLWATERPRTHHWGSGQIQERMARHWGEPDVIFGKQDQVEGYTVDRDPSVRPSVVADWEDLPFREGEFEFGYWDPPYLASTDKNGSVHYSLMFPCYREIVRVLRCRLAILHPMIYPNPKGWRRIAVIGVTFGPMKIIRSLQVWERVQSSDT